MIKKETKKSDARGRGDWQGMNWIRQDKRLAIYLRDGFACMYCGATLEDGATLSLDHIKPHSQSGSNSERNLVTCCTRCNSSRADRPVAEFAGAVAGYINHGITAEAILADIRSHTRMSLRPYRSEAKELIARRGSAARVLSEMMK